MTGMPPQLADPRLQSPIGPHSFVPTLSVTPAGHVLPFEETYRRVRQVLSKVPITRLTNVTPIDHLGLPVWSAVTPLAKDLTVHAGKGESSLAAQLSAIMEAIERVSAEGVATERVIRCRRADLARVSSAPVLDPHDFDLPYNTAYTPDREIGWIMGYDLVEQAPVWVALDLAISPASDGVCTGVETNGLASGNTHLEAAVHALYEVIERDAVSAETFCEMFSERGDRGAPAIRVVDPASLPRDTLAWVERLQNSGLEVIVQDLTSDIAVPVYGVTVLDSGFPGIESGVVRFAGYGADLRPSRAVFRAVTEATQSHTIVMLGARDQFEGTRPLPDRAAMLLRRLDAQFAGAMTQFPAQVETGPGDLLVDLRRIVENLRQVGLGRCVVVDLTSPRIGVPVVRVLVPGLSGPYGATTRRPPARLLAQLV